MIERRGKYNIFYIGCEYETVFFLQSGPCLETIQLINFKIWLKYSIRSTVDRVILGIGATPKLRRINPSLVMIDE